MWKAILLTTSTAIFALIGVLAARVANLGTAPNVFVTILMFVMFGFLLAFFTIRAADRNVL